jgi:hypothetical protein
LLIATSPAAAFSAAANSGVLLVSHFMTVGLIVASGVVDVGWVAVEQRSRIIVQADYVQRRAVLDLHAQQAFRDLRQRFHTAKPSADDAAHTCPARVLAVRPPAEAGRLREAGSHLPPRT